MPHLAPATVAPRFGAVSYFRRELMDQPRAVRGYESSDEDRRQLATAFPEDHLTLAVRHYRYGNPQVMARFVLTKNDKTLAEQLMALFDLEPHKAYPLETSQALRLTLFNHLVRAVGLPEDTASQPFARPHDFEIRFAPIETPDHREPVDDLEYAISTAEQAR